MNHVSQTLRSLDNLRNLKKININFQCYKQFCSNFFLQITDPVWRCRFSPESNDHHSLNTLYISHRNGNFVEQFSLFLSFLASIPRSFVNVYCYIHRCTEFNSRKPSLTQSIASRFTFSSDRFVNFLTAFTNYCYN